MIIFSIDRWRVRRAALRTGHGHRGGHPRVLLELETQCPA